MKDNKEQIREPLKRGPWPLPSGYLNMRTFGCVSGITVPSAEHYRKAGSAGLAPWPAARQKGTIGPFHLTASFADPSLQDPWHKCRLPGPPARIRREQKKIGVQPGLLVTTTLGADINSRNTVHRSIQTMLWSGFQLFSFLNTLMSFPNQPLPWHSPSPSLFSFETLGTTVLLL